MTCGPTTPQGDGSLHNARAKPDEGLNFLVAVAAPSAVLAMQGVVQGLDLDGGDPLASIVWGAASRQLVADGQVYRLLTACFQHADAAHALGNFVALGVLGWRLATLSGLSTWLVVALVAGIGGWSAALVLSPIANGVGASAMAYGAATYLAGRHIAHWATRGVDANRFAVDAAILAGFLLLAFTVESAPRTSHASHVGGAVAGIALGIVPHHVLQGRWIVRGCLGIVATSVASAVVVGLFSGRADAQRAYEAFLDDEGAPTPQIVALAFNLASGGRSFWERDEALWDKAIQSLRGRQPTAAKAALGLRAYREGSPTGVRDFAEAAAAEHDPLWSTVLWRVLCTEGEPMPSQVPPRPLEENRLVMHEEATSFVAVCEPAPQLWHVRGGPGQFDLPNSIALAHQPNQGDVRVLCVRAAGAVGWRQHVVVPGRPPSWLGTSLTAED